jgi:hypothetical protein
MMLLLTCMEAFAFQSHAEEQMRKETRVHTNHAVSGTDRHANSPTLLSD